MQLTDADLAEDDWLLLQVVSGATASRNSEKPWKIGLAVSGGGDSMAMLHLFAQCAEDQKYELSVATVDHGLRPEAREEALFVAEACEALNLPHQTLNWSDWDGKGNLQARARDARYALLADWARSKALDVVAIGHTIDDQAETFLARLARGSGLDGLAGMEPSIYRHDVEFIRPCLQINREMLRRYLRRNGHEWQDDPSNEDDQFQRVKARSALKALTPLGIDVHRVAKTASQLSLAKQALRDIAAQTASDIIRFEGGDIVIPWDRFMQANPEIGRRLLDLSLQWIGQTQYAPRSDAVHDMQQTIGACKVATLNGCLVTATAQDIRISREFEKVNAVTCATDRLWDGNWALNGPHQANFEIRALGPIGLPQCPDWREVGLPRTSLLSSPSIWSNDELIAAPLAKLNSDWTATLVRGEKQFFSSIVTH